NWPSVALRSNPKRRAYFEHMADQIWIGIVVVGCLVACALLARFVAATLTLGDVVSAFGLGLATMVRVVVLIAIASAVWIPIGVWVGLRPAWSERLQPVAQFLAAFPANVLFPVAVIVIIGLDLNPNVWLSPLMVLGTQWYILFNVIAGASALPNDL